MTKIMMHGCNGKMGQVISSIVQNDSSSEIVAGIDLFQGITNPYPVYQNLEDCQETVDVIIDFSTAGAIKPLLDYGIKTNTPIVLCTTGLDDETIALIHETSQKIPLLFSANMSLGVNLMINLAKKATQILTNANFDIEIIEKHHNQKVDAPSGTALAIADAINDTLEHSHHYIYDRSKDRVKRATNEIGIHALRGGTIVGEHSIIFAGQDEVLELKHEAHSKEIFAVGAVNAAKFLAPQPKGLYNMGHVIG